MKDSIFEKIKDKYKNAKEVFCPYRKVNTDFILETLKYVNGLDGYWCETKDGYSIEIYNKYFKRYAEIASYKNETNENIGQFETPKHYDNSKGSIYQFCENQNLNSYEFDIIKRVIRSRKKGNFKEDLEKTKHLIDLYLKEYEEIKD